MSRFVPLQEADESCGTKALVLGQLHRAGFAVPDGAVLPMDAPGGWERALPTVLESLGGSHFAVRSSARAEDGRLASFAGQFRTRLSVRSGEVENEIRRTATSLAAATGYAEALGQPLPGGVAVIVQRMLAPSAAGVAFTRDPVTGRRTIVLEAVIGLGDRLVSGQAQPERWRIAPGEKPRCHHPSTVLDDERAAAVGDLAVAVEELLGGGQDVEWALAHGRVWTLQARPITAATSNVDGKGRLPATPPDRITLASGTPASPGSAQGFVRIIKGLNDFSRFEPGEVLVCRATSPAWTPLLAQAAAVVTTTGGILAHAAILARELRIPAVTDVGAALDLPDGTFVQVDGTTGTITGRVAR